MAVQESVPQMTMAKLTGDEVRKVATLANLRFDDAELEKMTGTLAQILGHIDMLKKLDTGNVPPTSHALQSENVFRADEHTNNFKTELTLDNAPAKDRNYFSVPRIIE